MVKINDTVRLLIVGFMLQCAHLYYHENAYVLNCTLPIWVCSAIKWFEFEFVLIVPEPTTKSARYSMQSIFFRDFENVSHNLR